MGVDGIHIDSVRLSGKTLTITISPALDKLAVPWNGAYDLDLRIVGLPAGNLDVVLNGKRYNGVSGIVVSKLPVRVNAGGVVSLRGR